MARASKTTPSCRRRTTASQTASRKLPCNKWVVGMVQETAVPGASPTIRFFPNPRIYPSYDDAVRAAEENYHYYGKSFVVFAKMCVIGPSRPPILKQEYTT